MGRSERRQNTVSAAKRLTLSDPALLKRPGRLKTIYCAITRLIFLRKLEQERNIVKLPEACGLTRNDRSVAKLASVHQNVSHVVSQLLFK